MFFYYVCVCVFLIKLGVVSFFFPFLSHLFFPFPFSSLFFSFMFSSFPQLCVCECFFCWYALARVCVFLNDKEKEREDERSE